jgi:hypothetical protein
MEHFRVGEQHVGLVPGPCALVAVGIAVVGCRHQAGDLHGAEGTQLILGQSFGWVEEEGGAGAEAGYHRLGNWHLKAQ